jgi:hypothetical protein
MGFGDRAFPVSLLKSVTLASECLVIEIWYGLDLRFCWMLKGFGDWVFPVSLLKSITLTFERLVTKIWYEIGPSLLLDTKGFWRAGVPCIAVERRHCHLRASGHRNLRPLLAGY